MFRYCYDMLNFLYTNFTMEFVNNENIFYFVLGSN